MKIKTLNFLIKRIDRAINFINDNDKYTSIKLLNDALSELNYIKEKIEKKTNRVIK